MLLKLNISNFAVFEKESIDFENGFNVFTGETGSGKSILIEALSLILGERASKDFIRKGKKSSLLEAIFDISQNKNLENFLDLINIEIDDNDFLIISREIMDNGKSINKINGRTVPLNTIKEIGSYLIDIYGQFDNESLFKKENHIKMLDSLIDRDLSPLNDKYKYLYKSYNKKCEEIKYIQEKLINKDIKIEQLQYELNEIDDANIQQFEEEKLLNEIKKLSNVQEIKTSLYEVYNILSSDSNSSVNSLNKVYSILNKVKNFDDGLHDLFPRLELLIEELQSLIYDIRNYSEGLDVDDERLLTIENRISLINRLKRKYGFNLEKILEYRNSVEKELNIIKDAEKNLNELNIEKEQLFKSIKTCADKISNKRKDAAIILEKNLLKELHDLNMKNIKFKVNIIKKPDFSPDGIDSVEFLISTNIGSDLNSVQKVVSGGEASRIMLAFKKISCETDNSQTMVFDEIDAGISGKTAQMAGIKMNYISKNHQVICVTHSPQIASIAKKHFLIEKGISENNTFSTVKRIYNKDKIYEIARLLSGMKVTEKSLSNAKELIEISDNM
ncbi:DNA repair protein RecN [Sedimentibacter sp. MB31-C6]|uniref:DNA repair protein RecN n=1 Tax=Sedimentibacter sp. MB31-C6 TaxID=3109366 RepID=UPI002DDCA94B|nr:DNA repair protein RecN [Sedimentibacter sp. MB36-C1]WSI04193.1 DNA repair protein RecN [Sedimentibacter sp. MB36-C1]WSI05644.1 DNA repair protein RecN [Sedimentibacter sp. MB36-C1]